DWLKSGRAKGKPFLLMYQHKAPHPPWEPGPNQLKLYPDVTIPQPETLFGDHAPRSSGGKEPEMKGPRPPTPAGLKFVMPKGLTPEQAKLWAEAYAAENEAYRKAPPKGNGLVRWQYQRYIKDYLRCVAGVDDNVGRVLKYLDDSGLARDTIVIYA